MKELLYLEDGMSFLESVTKGKQVGPQIHVIAGNNGVGKTTWAAAFPDVLLLDLEDGSNHLDVARLSSEKIPDYQSFQKVLRELAAASHPYKTVVIDSAEALEALLSDVVCKEGNVTSIEKYDGGYGKGFTRTRELMRDVFGDIKALKAKGITVIIVAHTQVKSQTDPASNLTYDRVIMRTNDKMAALIRDLSDNVFYATFKVYTAKEGGKTKTFGDGQRVMFTQWRPGFDAKNRLELPLEIPLSYDAFVEACGQAPEVSQTDLLGDITAMMEKVPQDLKATVSSQVEKFKGNPVKLKEIKNRLMKYVA